MSLPADDNRLAREIAIRGVALRQRRRGVPGEANRCADGARLAALPCAGVVKLDAPKSAAAMTNSQAQAPGRLELLRRCRRPSLRTAAKRRRCACFSAGICAIPTPSRKWPKSRCMLATCFQAPVMPCVAWPVIAASMLYLDCQYFWRHSLVILSL